MPRLSSEFWYKTSSIIVWLLTVTPKGAASEFKVDSLDPGVGGWEKESK